MPPTLPAGLILHAEPSLVGLRAACGASCSYTLAPDADAPGYDAEKHFARVPRAVGHTRHWRWSFWPLWWGATGALGTKALLFR
ncbi:MAG TPA: hypothetical protein VF690_18145 [Hymenobacter sp.]